MKKRKRSTTQRFPTWNQPGAFKIVEFEITTEAIPHPRYERLPLRVQEAVERLHEMTLEQPAEAIPQLQDLIKKYPDIPMLYNFLSVAYTATNQKDEAEKAILDNYSRNPDYLFARINYADLCLSKRDFAKVAHIFDHKFDLKSLYPERKKFHVSEVTGFMGVVGTYFYRIGEPEAAASCLEVLRVIAPDNPRTKLLCMLLGPSLVKQCLRRIKELLNTGP